MGLARELDINVIAKGVETRAQSEMLKSWGCDGRAHVPGAELVAVDAERAISLAAYNEKSESGAGAG